MIVTLGTFFIKFIGMIYVIPFYHLVKEQGGALYMYGYIPFTIFLSIATGGIPLAVAKFVSKYNELGDYRTSRRIFKSGFLLMGMTGFIAFIALYGLAPWFAGRMLADDTQGNTLGDTTMVIRMTSFSLLLVPVMGLIRGFFQGHQSMGPTTLSQMVEQVVRIVVLLGAAFLILRVFGGSIAQAVGWATFSAFIGAAAGLAVLLAYWFKRKKHLNRLLLKQRVFEDLIPYKTLYKELLLYAFPFVFVGIAIPAFQQVDALTFNRTLSNMGFDKEAANVIFSGFTMYAHKLIMIPVSLATAFSLTLVPAITKLHYRNDRESLHRQISQILQATLFLTLPAVIGMSAIAYPLYASFYKVEAASLYGGNILRWYAPVAILFAFYSVNAAILQGLNRQKAAVVALMIGLLLKAVLNVPLIRLMGADGAVLATGIGFMGAVAYTFAKIKKYTHMNFHFVIRRSLLICLITLLMAGGVLLLQFFLSPLLSYSQGKWQSILLAVMGGIAGVAIYGGLTLKTTLASRILGERFTSKVSRFFSAKAS
ncbi:putative polysaccharide biosynthesis protein [Bacillus testis]|uniref:putative polysaccharide biosynthesis protein n=1 Tax=Bacillus testis TaxID=1622072 RepID=UPI00067F5566